MNWGVVVAAGGLESDPLASLMGTPRKSLAPIAGRPSLSWVLDAVRDAEFATCVTCCGEDARPAVHWGTLVPEGATGVASVANGVTALGETCEGVLILPGDAPALTGPMLRTFVEAVERRRTQERDHQKWYAAGLTRLDEFEAAFPGFPAHPFRLAEGHMLSGALFAASPAGFWQGASLFEAMRQSRRSQLGMVRRLGVVPLLRYLTGRVTLRDAEGIIGRLLEGAAWIVPDQPPATCLDFDDDQDYTLIADWAARTRTPVRPLEA